MYDIVGNKNIFNAKFIRIFSYYTSRLEIDTMYEVGAWKLITVWHTMFYTKMYKCKLCLSIRVKFVGTLLFIFFLNIINVIYRICHRRMFWSFLILVNINKLIGCCNLQLRISQSSYLEYNIYPVTHNYRTIWTTIYFSKFFHRHINIHKNMRFFSFCPYLLL